MEFEISRVQGEDPAVHVYTALGTVKGKKKIAAEIEGVLMPLADIEEPEEQKRFFAVLTRELKL